MRMSRTIRCAWTTRRGPMGPASRCARSLRRPISPGRGVDLPSLAESVRSVEERIARQNADYEALNRSYEKARDAQLAAGRARTRWRPSSARRSRRWRSSNIVRGKCSVRWPRAWPPPSQPRARAKRRCAKPSATRARRAPCGMRWPRATRPSRRSCIRSASAMLSSRAAARACADRSRTRSPLAGRARSWSRELKEATSEAEIARAASFKASREAVSALTGASRAQRVRAQGQSARLGRGEAAGGLLSGIACGRGTGAAASIRTCFASGTTRSRWTQRARGKAPCRPNAIG